MNARPTSYSSMIASSSPSSPRIPSMSCPRCTCASKISAPGGSSRRSSSCQNARSSLARSSAFKSPSELCEVSFGRTDVDRARADEAPRLLLLDDVRRPAAGARAGEEGGRDGGGDPRDLEDDGAPELDVRLE